MIEILLIFVILILADSFVLAKQNESIHSEYVSAKLPYSEINAEFIMRRIEYHPNQIINGIIFLREVSAYIKPTGRKERKGLFVCKCGVQFEALIEKVKRGHTNSCGCYQIERVKSINTIHGLANHPLYVVWANMKARCYNKNNKGYKNWGGRGITVCDEWLNNSNSFLRWALNNGYKKGLTIDRRDNNGDYTPDNCRFITQAENCRNSRNTKLDWGIVRKIRDLKLLIPKITQKEIANIYRVSKVTVGRVLNNKAWNEYA